MESLVQLYLLLAIFCLLMLKSFREIFSNNYLKGLLLLLFLITALKMLTKAGLIMSSPVVYLSGNTALFLFMPAVYLYIRNVVYSRHITIKDILHCFPAIAYSLSWMVISMVENASLAQADVFNTSGSIQPPALLFFLVFGYAVTGWYLLLVLKILKDRVPIPRKTELIAPAAVFVKEQVETTPNIEIHTSSLYLSDEKIFKIDLLIKEFLEQHQPFLRHGYSLKLLAEETQLPVHLLSAFINKYYKVNFNDFINEYRVHYCKVKILNDEWKYKKLEAIADESGFSNRNTFTAAFKRVTGLNPSEFLKTIKDQQAA